MSDLRRLLISGVNAEAEVGAYPVKYTYRLPDPSRRPARVDALLADLRLHGVTYVPVVSAPSGKSWTSVSADDLTAATGRGGRPATRGTVKNESWSWAEPGTSAAS